MIVLPDQGSHEIQRNGAGEDVGGEEGQDDAGEDGDEQRDGDRIDPEPPHLARQEGKPGTDIGEGASRFHAAAAHMGDEAFPGGDTGCRGYHVKLPRRTRRCSRVPTHAAKLARARPTSPSRSRLSARSRS